MTKKSIVHSIGGKVLALASLITVLVFTALFLVSFFAQRKAASKRIALVGRNASGMVGLAMDGVMLRGNTEEMRAVFQKARELNPDLTLFLTDKDGKIKFATHEERVESSLTAPETQADLRQMVGDAVQKDTNASGLARLDGKLSYLQVKSVPNEVRCQGCHEASIPFLGSMVVVQDVSGEWNAMNIQNAITAGLSLAGLAILVFSLSRMIGTQITRPLAGFGHVLERVADGELTHKAQEQSQDELGDMGRALNHTIGTLRMALHQIQDGAVSLASGTTELSVASQQLRGAADSNAQNLELLLASNQSTSSSVQQLAASVGEITTLTQTSQTESLESIQAALRGTAAGEKAENSMKQVRAASARMVSAVQVIHEIAKQSSLLSLNASIEAAKAGASGRGFAVVAEEVRKLAERSSASAKEIDQLIQTAEQAGAEGTATMIETVQALKDIHNQVVGLAARLDKVRTATREQGVATADVGKAVADTIDKTENVFVAIEQTAATITEVSRTTADHAALAETLHQLAGKFQL